MSARKTPNVTQIGKTGRSRSRTTAVLICLLGVTGIAFVATGPMRARMARNTEQMEREIALQNEALTHIKELGDAEETARKLVAEHPGNVQAHLAYASALGQNHKYPEAAEEVKAAEALEPRSAEPHIVLAEISNAGGIPNVAIQEYRRALALEPRNPRALSLLAYKYVALGWNEEARQLLNEALKANPNEAKLHVNLGLVHFQSGDYIAAEQELLTARRLAPADTSILAPLADVYRRSKKFPEALQTLEQAIEAMPNVEVLRVAKARTFLEMDKPDQAIEIANNLLKTTPDNPDALYARAMAEKAKGSYEQAIRDFEKIRAKDPAYEDLLLYLGQAYIRTGNQRAGKSAIAEFNERRAPAEKLGRLTLLVSQRANDANAHLELGRYYLQSGSTGRAIVEIERVLELRPKDAAARKLLDEALQKNGRQAPGQAVAGTSTGG
jgi:tetratricopeptide (TPR) repeat protein